MREMQAKAFKYKNNQYILIKAPPASGKSRALMFLALDKLHNQSLKKAIIAVPERAIGASFKKTKLMEQGFYADWDYPSKYDLCVVGGEKNKIKTFMNFLKDTSGKVLICTHSTLRYAFDMIQNENFNNTLLAIDEFHHVSASSDNRLGEVLRCVMANSNAHIIAMTGSYFRGDAIPVLLPEDEAKFSKINYSYYEQLSSYTYLKTLGIGYHFYQGKYWEAISEVLNTNEKTIIHIPNVNAGRIK